MANTPAAFDLAFDPAFGEGLNNPSAAQDTDLLHIVAGENLDLRNPNLAQIDFSIS
ncbi:conserved hypothetical protein [Bacillus altitudinis]|uniref:Uncharacterized protein n=1 Tax=Bacillus altitudinis TaxID=293387 RepID=A0A653XK49_BACAB|nr:conserved hypothetical protein [Bacillus altitudinis]VXC16388.1 hypothetical protein BACI9J_60810 [Bacillus altitudinis]VXC30425.1 hypothetical protein BACI348_50811 [Bacillus altitudinis]